MANIEEHNKSMTLFYYKRDGGIHSYCTGIADMRSFGQYEDDYAIIIDFIVVPIDRTVIEYLNQFYVDVETKQIKLKPNGFFDFTKYQ